MNEAYIRLIRVLSEQTPARAETTATRALQYGRPGTRTRRAQRPGTQAARQQQLMIRRDARRLGEAYRRIITILSEITAGHGKGVKFSDSGGLIGNVSSSKRQRQHPSERTKAEGRKARVKRLRTRHTERAGTQKAQGDAPWSGYDTEGTSARYVKIGNKKQAPIDWDKIKSIKSEPLKSKVSAEDLAALRKPITNTPEEIEGAMKGNINRSRAMKEKIGKPK